jgi:hypothetical protein
LASYPRKSSRQWNRQKVVMQLMALRSNAFDMIPRTKEALGTISRPRVPRCQRTILHVHVHVARGSARSGGASRNHVSVRDPAPSARPFASSSPHGAINTMVVALRATFGLHLQKTHSGCVPACGLCLPRTTRKHAPLTTRLILRH